MQAHGLDFVSARVAAVLDAFSPRPLCDDCLAMILHRWGGDRVKRAARFLWGEFGYFRSEGRCERCGSADKAVTRKNRRG